VELPLLASVVKGNIAGNKGEGDDAAEQERKHAALKSASEEVRRADQG
jgi:hypothetical protein